MVLAVLGQNLTLKFLALPTLILLAAFVEILLLIFIKFKVKQLNNITSSPCQSQEQRILELSQFQVVRA